MRKIIIFLIFISLFTFIHAETCEDTIKNNCYKYACLTNGCKTYYTYSPLANDCANGYISCTDAELACYNQKRDTGWSPDCSKIAYRAYDHINGAMIK